MYKVSLSFNILEYWRRSSRGCDYWLTLQLDLGNWKLLTTFPVPEMYVLPAIPILGAVLKDMALRAHLD